MNLAVQVKTMSSTEIAALVEKEKFNVHRDIKTQILKGLYSIEDDSNLNDAKIQGVTATLDSRGYVSEYHLDKEHTLTLITGYDVKKRHAINKRWLELEQQVTMSQPVYSGTLRAEESLRIADFLAQSLRVSESGKLGMFTKVLELKAPELISILPAYAVDAPIGLDSSLPTKAAKTLLEELDYGISVQAFNKLALAEGFLEKLTRPSTSKTTKEFWSITDKGLKYGKNITNPKDPRETQPHWYIETFKELADLIIKGA